MPSTHRLSRPWALVASLALTLVACGSSGTVSRVRVPIAENPVGAAKAEQCVATCRAHHDNDIQAYGSCLAECPGAEIEYGQRCRALRQGPRTACAEMAMHRPRPEQPARPSSSEDSSSDNEGGGFLGALLGAVVEGAVEAAVRPRGSSSSSSSSSSEGGQAAPSTQRVASGSSHAAATPSKDHAKATPSRGSSSDKGKEKKPRVD
jgi:hypothetical protein